MNTYVLILQNYLTLFPYQYRKKREFTIIIEYLVLHWFLAGSNSFITVFKLLY